MTALERAVWEDAEGSLVVSGRTVTLETAQSSPQVLEDYCEGAIRDGVVCTVEKRVLKPSWVNPKSQVLYRSIIRQLGSVAREIQLTEPHRRSPVREKQIKRFKAFIRRRRLRIGPEVLRAREILGIF